MPHELIMPKMGESIMEATILNWVKKVGDYVDVDETVLEIATDKVDSEVPSPVSGTITKIFFEENDTVEIGKVIALIETGKESSTTAADPIVEHKTEPDTTPISSPAPSATSKEITPVMAFAKGRFYSPLVKNIARNEQISVGELDAIEGTGMGGRVTKRDVLAYLDERKTTPPSPAAAIQTSLKQSIVPQNKQAPAITQVSDNVEIIEMDRMRKLIAEHMVHSKHTSPHVTSFVEVDVTNIVNWRNKVKKSFEERHGEKITFTPVFIEAVAKALQDYPMVNISVEGSQIIRKKNINIGMAAALPSGNLIVPVIKNADHLSLLGLAKAVNDYAQRARANKLKPEEIQGGTFTLTNVGTFGNVMGTPIINQPQVAILATGAIRKKPAVVETPYGDLIAVRHMMFLSLSYDHRVVDGALGGSFLRRVGDYLEQFEADKKI